jgi:hypothetical protein
MEKVQVTSSFTIAFTIRGVVNEQHLTLQTSGVWELPQGSKQEVLVEHEGSTIYYTINAQKGGEILETHKLQGTLPPNMEDIKVSVKITE